METASTRVAIFGDWHKHTIWAARSLRAAAEAGITEFIHVGDHQIHWPTREYTPGLDGPMPPVDDYTRTNVELAEELGLHGIIVDGNHENHAALTTLPVDEHGFGVISPNLRHARRGTRATIGGRQFGFLGGAFSINYQYLVEGRSVWKDLEQCAPADVEALGREPLDVLISHDIPEGTKVQTMFGLPYALEKESKKVRDLLLEAATNTKPSLIFAGHWHQRVSHQLNQATRVEVLNRENTAGNGIILDTADMSITPLVVPARPSSAVVRSA